MWLPVSTTVAAALWVLMDTAFDVGGASSSAEDAALEVTFSERTRADWEKVWHQESHSRCRDKLIRHLYWACEKDIYRISRRNDDYGGGNGAVGKRANGEYKWDVNWRQLKHVGFHGVTVSTQDSESCDPSSNLGGT